MRGRRTMGARNCAYLLLLLLTTAAVSALNSCGYDKCHPVEADAINVHMVSHSHDDVGWVKTVNQYYEDQVRHILDSVVDALLANPQRKFIQVETAFLYLWWKRQSKQRKDQVRYLVKNGQLEIAGGAWSMNDEATAHYQSIIDQFTLGLRFINDTLGPCAAPKVGWQVDPFGHSRQMATIFTEMGFKSLFFGRLDYRDKNARMANKTMEMMWRGHPRFGKQSEIFTSAMYNLYQPPEGFCFDNVCGYRIGPYNEEQKVKQFIYYIEELVRAYKTNNILITMGGDFTYSMAEVYFRNIDFLMNSIMKRGLRIADSRKINIFYSTPACYFNAVQTSSNLETLPVKTDDFFPYADKANSYWTGFYTSRPTSKRYEREGNNLLQVSKQLAVLAQVGSNRDIFDLASAMGVMQHHDAITGTEKQYVADDYARTLHATMGAAVAENSRRIAVLQSGGGGGGEWSRDLITCTLANMSICTTSGQRRFAVVLYNPLAHAVSHHVRLPVAHRRYTIRKSLSEKIPYQISRPLRLFNSSHGESHPYELTFLAENIPPLGIKQYLLTVDEQADHVLVELVQPEEFLELGTKELGILLDASCKIRSLFTPTDIVQFQQKLMYYNSKVSANGQFAKHRPSGAYIFAPDGPAHDFSNMTCTIYRGPLFDEIRQEYEPWAGQIVRVFKDNKKYVEIDWTVGRIQLTKFQGKEIISLIKTNLNSVDLFRTDTNGRSYITRKRNYRETYPLDVDDPISGNYYPLTTYLGIQDVTENKYLTVFTDRAQGGTSLASGEVEIMLHRRLVQDDSLGVEEVLDETDDFRGGVARGQHVIDFGTIRKRDDETISRELLLKPLMFLVPVGFNDMNVWRVINTDYSGLTRELPKDVHLLTLEPWKKWEDKILLRLEHINEHGFTETVDLKNLFTAFKILDIHETNLAANEWKSDNKQRHASNVPPYVYMKLSQSLDKLHLVMKPLQIRTFVLSIKYYT